MEKDKSREVTKDQIDFDQLKAKRRAIELLEKAKLRLKDEAKLVKGIELHR